MFSADVSTSESANIKFRFVNNLSPPMTTFKPVFVMQYGGLSFFSETSIGKFPTYYVNIEKCKIFFE